MKKVVSGNILRSEMEKAINLLCNTVKSTLGPKGSNAIIDHSTFSPFITNDGVTIAENITSDDEVVNTILELAKEASIKTNEVVGDGTTSTLVFLQSIFNNGLNLIKEGYNPIILKDELYETLEIILKEIENNSKMPSQEELKYIASVSSNDNEIGKIVSDVYLDILNRNAINIKEGDTPLTKVTFLKGYTIDSLLASPYFLNNTKKLNFATAKILLINGHLDDISKIANIINTITSTMQNLIIIASSFNAYLVEEIVNLNMSTKSNIVLLNAPLYGLKKVAIYKDLQAITNAKIIENADYISEDYLGESLNITINNETATFNFKMNNQVKKHIIDLNNLLNNSSEDNEFVMKRLTMLEKGSATITVGGLTKTERREKKMRYIDSLWAISTSSCGISYGGGLTSYIVSQKINNETKGSTILKEALKEPMKVILLNAGLNADEIIKKITDSNYQLLYNVKNNNYENVKDTKVLDPTNVIKEEITNAVSIAAMLLTTENLIINEIQNNLNSINEYDNI